MMGRISFLSFEFVFLHSVKGKLDDPETCKIFGYLISTLNASFPDYDFRFVPFFDLFFSSVKPDQFQCISNVMSAVNEINHYLSEVSEINMRGILFLSF